MSLLKVRGSCGYVGGKKAHSALIPDHCVVPGFNGIMFPTASLGVCRSIIPYLLYMSFLDYTVKYLRDDLALKNSGLSSFLSSL